MSQTKIIKVKGNPKVWNVSCEMSVIMVRACSGINEDIDCVEIVRGSVL